MFLLPTYDNGQVNDGEFIFANEYCKNGCAKGKCKAFYANIDKCEGLVTCPHGFSVFIIKRNNRTTVFNSLKVKGNYDKTKLSSIAKYVNDEFCPIISADKALKLINKDLSITQEKEYFDSFTHEIKNLDAQIKEHCESIFTDYSLDDSEISLSAEDANRLYDVVKTIYICSSIIHSRYALINYEKGAEIVSKESYFPISIYKKFDKMRKVFANYKSKNVQIHITGNSFSIMKGDGTFEMVPLLIIENAVKYSMQNKYVTIDIRDDYNDTVVEISSLTPYCDENDIAHMFERGYRGKNAKKIEKGNGLGLYFVKTLCDKFEIKLSATSKKDNIKKYNNIDYAPFTITLIIPTIKA